MTTRRQFLGLALGGVFPASVASAQPSGTVPRLGFLATASLDSPEMVGAKNAVRQGLRDHGYVEGKSIVIEYRSADGKLERLPALAAELVRARVDIILALNSVAAREALRATSTIPIVAPLMADPVGDGLVQSLFRPGGNLTGFTFLGHEYLHERLSFLKEALPKITRVVGLWHPGAVGPEIIKEGRTNAERTARQLKMQLQLVDVKKPDELEPAFAAMVRDQVDAAIVFPSPLLFHERRRTVELAAKHRLPVMSNVREFVELGGLMAYGARLSDLYRRSGVYVDRILAGESPADLAVGQAITFELLVNLKTARTLGLSIPASFLSRADVVIQ